MSVSMMGGRYSNGEVSEGHYLSHMYSMCVCTYDSIPFFCLVLGRLTPALVKRPERTSNTAG